MVRTWSGFGRVSVLVLAGLSFVVAAPASAEPVNLFALQAAAPDSTFTLSFSGQALPSSFISNTNFQLELDSAIAGGTARFVNYYQNVAPLTLPDGQGGFVNTGDLTVTVVPGSSGIGTFDSLTGAFTTSETYRIDYTGDLRPIGLDDGGTVYFDSTSNGLVTFDNLDPSFGSIEQHWSGYYMPLGLDYTCQVYSVFPEPASMTLLALGALALRRRR